MVSKKIIDEWLSSPFDQETQDSVKALVKNPKKLEDALSNNFSPSAIDNINISSKGFNADIHASAEYRAHIIKVMAKKAVSSC